MYISYDLGKAIQREKLARAMSEFETRRPAPAPEPTPRWGDAEGADVIELVFSSHCETDRIGA
jgi:hypothetical protein